MWRIYLKYSDHETLFCCLPSAGPHHSPSRTGVTSRSGTGRRVGAIYFIWSLVKCSVPQREHFLREAEDGYVWMSLGSLTLRQKESPDLSPQLLSGHCSDQEPCLQSSAASHQGLFAVRPRPMARLGADSARGHPSLWYFVTKAHCWKCDLSFGFIFLTEP